jgi:hypothetical protein
VRISSRRAVNAAAQRRIDLHADRAKTSTVRDAFPGVEVIHIHLGFAETHPPPSPQRHSLYPAARAFFRFACPCADCDGEFDLAAVVAELVTAGAPAKRSTGRSVTGRTHCGGIHWRDSDHSEPCRIELSFRVLVTFDA